MNPGSRETTHTEQDDEEERGVASGTGGISGRACAPPFERSECLWKQGEAACLRMTIMERSHETSVY